MNQRSDIDRTLEIWMADGPTSISDHIVDVVAGRIARQRQRRAWPFPGGTTVTTQIKLIAAAAAVIVFAVVGWNLLPKQPGVGGQDPTPSPSPSPTATPESSPVALTEGTLTGGSYILQPLNDPSSIRIVADIPAGWHAFGDTFGAGALSSPGQTDGILVAFMVTEGLFADSCHWDLNGTGLEQPGDVVVGPTVDDLVAALKANTSYTSSAASPVTFGLFEGQELELQLPGDDVLSTCDMHGAGSPFTGTAFYVFPGGFYAQGPNSRWHLYIVDIEGTRMITMISIVETATAADIAAAEAIVASFEITP